MANSNIRIRLRRSLIGRPVAQRETVRALGLRRIDHAVEREDTPAIRGMVRAVAHLVTIEEVQKSAPKCRRPVKQDTEK